MEKKKYVSPQIEVIVIGAPAQLLAGSAELPIMSGSPAGGPALAPPFEEADFESAFPFLP